MRNVGKQLPDYTPSHTRRPYLSSPRVKLPDFIGRQFTYHFSRIRKFNENGCKKRSVFKRFIWRIVQKMESDSFLTYINYQLDALIIIYS